MAHWKRTNPSHERNTDLPNNFSTLPQNPSGLQGESALQSDPLKLNSQPRVSYIPSENRLARESLLSQQKRVRLRDYLFTARSSLQKNRQLRKDLKNKIVQEQQRKASIEKLKKSKYYISNFDMHKIVKKEIEDELANTIETLKEDLNFIKGQDLEQVSSDDLAYFYRVRKIVFERIRPSIEEMKQASLIRQKTIIQQMFSLGKNLVESKKLERHASKKSQDLVSTEELSNKPEKSPRRQVKEERGQQKQAMDLIQSLFLVKKQQRS